MHDLRLNRCSMTNCQEFCLFVHINDNSSSDHDCIHVVHLEICPSNSKATMLALTLIVNMKMSNNQHYVTLYKWVNLFSKNFNYDRYIDYHGHKYVWIMLLLYSYYYLSTRTKRDRYILEIKQKKEQTSLWCVCMVRGILNKIGCCHFGILT